MIESLRNGCPQTNRLEPNPVEEDRAQSKLFEAFMRELLRQGNGIRFQARGASMSPAIRDGEIVRVDSIAISEMRSGDIVLVKGERGFRLHRLVIADAERDVYITRGDCGEQDDPAVSSEEIMGMAMSKEVRVGGRVMRVKLNGLAGRLICGVARGQRLRPSLQANLLARVLVTCGGRDVPCHQRQSIAARLIAPG